MQLRDALDQAATASLRRMAAVHGVAHDDASTRAELISRLVERFADGVHLAGQLSALSVVERAALTATVAAGGEIRGFVLERDFPAASGALVERGFLVRTFAAAGVRRGEVFGVPDEVRALLPPPEPDALPPAAAADAPAERRSSDPAFSLFALASTLQRPSAELEAEVGGWTEEPGGWDWRARWTFLLHLGQACGLFAERTPTSALRRWLSDPLGLSARLWRAYRDTRAWSELGLAGGPPDVDVDALDPALIRARLLDYLERLPEGGWIQLQVVSDWLRRSEPELVRDQLDARLRLRLEHVGWDDFERHLIRAVLLGPLYWLGRVAVSSDGQFIARRAAPQVIAPEPCSWLDAAVLVAPARADLGRLLQAERYLILEQRGRSTRYRLDQQHVAAALASGGSLDECRRLLESLTQAGLPPAIAGRLGAWRERFGALVVRPAVLLEARSQSELEAVMDEPAVRPYLRRRLGPMTVDIPAADALGLAEALRAAGHLPRVDAALRLAADPRRAYPGLVDEQVLEFLLVSLLAFRQAQPDQLAELEGALSLLERLERQFAPERLAALRTAARRLAGDLRATSPAPPPSTARQPRGRRRR